MIGKLLVRALAMIGTFLAAVVITLLISLNMLCSERFPHVQQTFVTTILETGQLKFLASWFLSAEEIQAIVDQNSMKELKAEINTDLIQKGSFGNIDIHTEAVGLAGTATGGGDREIDGIAPVDLGLTCF